MLHVLVILHAHVNALGDHAWGVCVRGSCRRGEFLRVCCLAQTLQVIEMRFDCWPLPRRARATEAMRFEECCGCARKSCRDREAFSAERQASCCCGRSRLRDRADPFRLLCYRIKARKQGQSSTLLLNESAIRFPLSRSNIACRAAAAF
jgi:hypothetical protein